MINSKKDKDAWATPGQAYLFSQFFKPITRTARTIERVEMRISRNIVGMAEVMLIKTIEPWRGGGLGFGFITLIGRGG